MKKYIPFLLVIAMAGIITSCSKDNMEPAPIAIPYQKIGEGQAIGAGVKAELYASQALTAGYNTVYIALYDSISKKAINTAQIRLLPMMDMGTMQHACPVENPAATASNGLFQGAAVFTMPSGDMGSWTLGIQVAHGEKTGTLQIPVTVAAPKAACLKSFVSKADKAKFIVAYLQPQTSKVGVNDMEIAIYKAKNMMEFPADSSLTVALTPEMPTMGHGSPNNVAPVHTGKGHYKGKVNFTMTGLWYLHLDFKAGSTLADDATFFEVNF